MSSQWQRAVIASLLMILSSLAGCIGNDSDDESVSSVGTVMVSTYHVSQLASAVGGDLVDVQMMSTSNEPVHDYRPSADDLIRLNQADVFLYHGLGLEAWVDDAIENMEADGPLVAATHAMPSGEETLNFEMILINTICTSLNNPRTADVNILAEHPEDADELHSDDGAYNMAFPEDDHEDHDEDGHDEDGHDEHDEDGHDEGGHDEHDHGDHEQLQPEETFVDNVGCPTGTVINVYHFEAGDYMLEFEAEGMETFSMAIAAMAGAHDHGHGHGHGSGPFEWAGIFEVDDDVHTWTMAKVGGSYADPMMRVVIIPTDTPTESTMHSLEGGVEALIEGDCPVVNDGEMMTPIVAGGSCFELTVNQDSDVSSFELNTTGMTGFAAYTAHSPYEFEADEHYLKDSAGNNVEHIAEEGGGGHGDHGDHGDEHGDEHGDHFVCHDMSTHENNDEFTNEADCEAAGHFWMEDEGHGDEDGHGVCHDANTHESHDEYHNEAECVEAGHLWMEGDHDDGPESPAEALEMFDTNNDSFISLEEFNAAMEEDEHDDDHLDERNHYTMTVVMDDETHMIEFEVEDLVPNATATNMTTDGLAMDNMTWNISGGMLYAIDDVASPSDWSWYWQLHLWNETSGWYASESGMDLIMMEDAVHIAWAKNTTDDSTILPPPHHMDHDDHDDVEHELEMAMNTYIFGAADANSDGLLNMSDLETLFEMLEDTMDSIDTDAMVSIYFDVFDEDENDLISLGEFTEMMESMSDDDHDDDHGAHDDDHGAHDDDHGGDDDHNETEMLDMMFTMLDANGDGSLNASELHDMMEMGEDDHEEGVAFIGFHVEEEGDYALAVPEGVTMHVLTSGGHDGHDDHSGHDDHGDDHGEESGDDHSEEDGHDDHADEEIAFDPHSWLDPVAFAAQLEVVYATLSEAFPDHAEAFRANADAYKAQLLDLDAGFSAALSDTGTCSTNTIAANHNAYAYISQRYGVEFVTLHGLDPEGEPSPENVADVLESVEEDGIKAIFVEEYTANDALDSLIQQTVSDELPDGLAILTLYTMEIAPMDSDENYMTMMTKNLDHLMAGMGC